MSALALALAGCAARRTLGPGPTVVWVSGQRAYVATRDSSSLAPGDSVIFDVRGRIVAAGSVASVRLGEMAMIAVSTGSLAGVANLSQVTPRTVPRLERPPARLRVGCPSARRATLLFACAQVDVQGPGFYRRSTVSERLLQLVRDSGSGTSPWPDTLEVRWFDEAADEEIAIERGELDVALFWPGELSKHMRDHPRWGAPLVGTTSWGRLGIALGIGDTLAASDVAGANRRILTALGRDLFGGDLVPLGAAMNADSSTAQDVLRGRRLFADPLLPGRRELQRYLDRLVPAPPVATAAADSVLLFFRDLRAPEPSYEVARRTTLVLAIGCPVVSAPQLRRYLGGLGPDALADLVICRSSHTP